MSSTSMNGEWVVVETMRKGAPPTVVADGGRSKEWTSLARARSDAGARVAAEITRIVARCAEHGDRVSTVVPGRRGPAGVRLIAEPIIGPFATVHGVQFWLGPEDSDVPPSRIVGGWDFEMASYLMRNGPSMEETVFAIAPEHTRFERSPTDNYNMILRFDELGEYISFLTNGADGDRYQYEMTVLRADGAVREIQAIVCLREGPTRRALGIFHDISDVRASRPLLTSASLRAVAARSTSNGLGAIHLGWGLVYGWHVPPSSPLDRWLTENPEFGEGDLEKLIHACGNVAAGAPRELVEVRIRFPGDPWIAAELSITVLSEEFLAEGVAPQGLVEVRVP